MLSKQYESETDYCKIPREYLDTNISKGRGSVKWQPFATEPCISYSYNFYKYIIYHYFK